jgi:hypothetical protein
MHKGTSAPVTKLWPFRAQSGNYTLDKISSGRRHPSKQRIADLLDLLQRTDRCEKLLLEDISARMQRSNVTRFMHYHEFQELEVSPTQRRYNALLRSTNRLLRRYRSVPVLQPAFLDIDELTGLRIDWEMGRGSKWEDWENEAVHLILRVIESNEFHRLRKCRNCSKWFYGQTDHQVHCSDNCRKQFATKDPRFKERRRLYMAKRRKKEKALDKKMARVARALVLDKHRRMK